MVKTKLILVVAFCWLLPNVVNAASLSIVGESTNGQIGDSLTARVVLDAGSIAVNAAAAAVVYDTNVLQLVKIDSAKSIISNWVRTPYEARPGRVQFEGVAVDPGFNGSLGELLTLQFRVKQRLATTVKLSEGRVLAHDGAGTDVLLSKNDWALFLSSVSNKKTTATPLVPDTKVEFDAVSDISDKKIQTDSPVIVLPIPKAPSDENVVPSESAVKESKMNERSFWASLNTPVFGWGIVVGTLLSMLVWLLYRGYRWYILKYRHHEYD